MRVAFESAVSLAADHPLIALSLLVFVGIPLVLGWMHEGRFFGECAIVGIRFFKHEVDAWADFLRRLKRELTTWKADP
jgi:ACR3 family arsenite efflux pump ArsB